MGTGHQVIKDPKIEDLSQETQKILLAKRVCAVKSFDEWHKTLGELALFDSYIDVLQKDSEKNQVQSIIWAVVFFFLSIFLPLFIHPGLLFLFGFGFLYFIYQSIYYYSRLRKFRNLNLSNDFRDFLIPLLKSLETDFPQKSKVRLILDFSGVEPKKQITKRNVPSSRFSSVEETEFLDRWMRLSTVFPNGSRLKMRVENLVVSSNRGWQNANGKSKSKTKWKKRVSIRVAMTPPKGVKIGEPGGGFKISSRPNGDWLSGKMKWKYSAMGVCPDSAPKPVEVIGLIFQVCSQFQGIPVHRTQP